VESLLVLLMAAMALDVIWQVFTRYCLSDPSGWTEECARYLLMWVGLLGASYAFGRRQHLALELLALSLKPSAKARLDRWSQIAVIVFAAVVLIFGGIRLTYITGHLEQTSAALGIPLSYVYAIVPLSGVLTVFYALCHLLGDETEEQSVGIGKE